MNRRAFISAAVGSAGVACSPVPPGLRAPVLPDDHAAVFQALLSGRPVPPVAQDARWQVAADPPGSVVVAGDALRLNGPAAHRAWASPRLPLTPLNGARPGQVEELTWDTSLQLEQRFFVVCELRFSGEPGAVLLQATPFDLQVFQEAGRPQGGRSESISRLVGDGAQHFWRLHLDAKETALWLDGSVRWSLPGARTLARVAFGETRGDPQHGGAMLLRNVVYVRRPT